MSTSAKSKAETALVLAGLALCSMEGLAAAAWQTGEETKRSFEAASIKRDRTQRNDRAGKKITPGRMTIDNMPFNEIIEESYGLKGYQLDNAPKWLESENYDLVATSSIRSTPSQMETMLKTLLADRLQMRFHWAPGETQGFLLKVGARGPKFHASSESAIKDPSMLRERVEVGKFASRKVTMDRLASYLSIVLQAPVADQTNLSGDWDINLEFSSGLKQGDPDSALPAPITAVEEQLGLKLIRARVPIRMFVIDHIERPTED